MNRTKKTVLNAIAQITSVILQSTIALFITREIIFNIGSDSNGINSTATQLLSILTLLEGGFTLASLVKLYRPYNEGNNELLSKYLTLSKKKYQNIGLLYLVIGLALAVVYTPFVKTDVDYITTFAIIALSVISSAFNIFYVSKYRLLFQVAQTEYVFFFSRTVVYLVMYAIEFYIIRVTKSIILVRLCVTLFQVLHGLIVAMIAKASFKKINYNSDYKGVEITGTRDVFISRVSGMLYQSSTVLFISSFVGTVYTSIYSVYNSIMNIMISVISSFLSAPRNALGQIINSSEPDHMSRTIDIVNEYDFISAFLVSLLYSVTTALVIPFVRIYTADISDANYMDIKIAICLILIGITQMIHIPSGNCIEVSGRFKAVRKIQTTNVVLLILFSAIGVYCDGLYGILIAKLAANIVLASTEIIYTRRVILQNSILKFLRLTGPSLLVGSVIAVIEFIYLKNKSFSIFKFLLFGVIVFVLNLVVLLVTNRITNSKYLISTRRRFTSILHLGNH